MIIITLLLLFSGAQSSPLFDFLPPVVVEDTQIHSNPNQHTTIFFPIGKYATDVHYQIIRIPIHLKPMEEGFANMAAMMHHINNVVKGKATKTY
jgi:hypothetical protein